FEPGLPRPAVDRRRRTALAGLAGWLVVLAAGGTAWRALLSGSPTSTAGSAAAPAAEPAATTAASDASAPTGAAPSPSGGAGAPVAAAPPNAGSSTTPAGGVPRIDAPSVPMTIKANQPNPAPFDVPKL